MNKINDKIKSQLGYDFNGNFELLVALSMHMQPMMTRLRYGMMLPNPVFGEINVNLPKAVDCAVIAADEIRGLVKKEISDDELCYLALHYGMAIERYHEKRKDKKFVIVCNSGVGTEMVLKQKIKRQFKTPLEDIQTIDVGKCEEFDFEQVDYVVITVRIPVHIDKKIIHMNNMFGDMTLEEKKAENFDALNSIIMDSLIHLNLVPLRRLP